MKDKERFEKYFDKTLDDKCWEWKGCITSDKYGKFWLGKTMKSHKVSYLLYKGNIPSGKCVLHDCDNSLCVNPKHLRIGTQTENIKEMYSKGRGGDKYGEKCGNHKLKWEDITTIRESYNLGARILSIKYHVNYSTIRKIITNKTWKVN